MTFKVNNNFYYMTFKVAGNPMKKTLESRKKLWLGILFLDWTTGFHILPVALMSFINHNCTFYIRKYQ